MKRIVLMILMLVGVCILAGCKSEKETKEFEMILDMVARDVLQNEYEVYAFISNQVDRFGELFGSIAKPSLEKFFKVLENMDEETINQMIAKFNKSGIKDKLKIFK